MLRNLETKALPLEGALVITPQESKDERGCFFKYYAEEPLKKFGIALHFSEGYISVSKKNVLRGLHYQAAPFTQAKLVQCIHGAVYDVVVDLRKSSPTFRRWSGMVLSRENLAALYVPRGFAHGFVARTANATLLYHVDNLYSAQHGRGILWSDPELGIDWGVKAPTLNGRDRAWPLLSRAEFFD